MLVWFTIIGFNILLFFIYSNYVLRHFIIQVCKKLFVLLIKYLILLGIKWGSICIILSGTYLIYGTILYRLACILAARVKDWRYTTLMLIIIRNYPYIFNLCIQYFLLLVMEVVLICSDRGIPDSLWVALSGIFINWRLLNISRLFWISKMRSVAFNCIYGTRSGILNLTMELTWGNCAVMIKESSPSIAHLNWAFNIHMYIIFFTHYEIWCSRTISPWAFIHFLISCKPWSHQQRRDPSSCNIFRTFSRNLPIALSIEYFKLEIDCCKRGLMLLDRLAFILTFNWIFTLSCINDSS